MNKNLISKIIITVVVITLVVLIPVAYIFIHSCDDTKTAAIDPTHSALVLDYSLKGNYTEKAILNNRGALIGLQAENTKNGNIDVFNSLSGLNSLDANKDGRLDAKDPMFSHIILVFLDEHGKQRFVNLQKAGITEIVFQHKIATLLNSIESPVVGYAQTKENKKINMVLVQDKDANFN